MGNNGGRAMGGKQYILLVACVVTVSAVLLGIYASSPMSGDIYRAGFDRRFTMPSSLVQKAGLDLKYNSFYLAGAADTSIYLGNVTAPFLMSLTGVSLKKLHQVRMQIPNEVNVLNSQKFRVVVDSPYFYLFNGTTPQILAGTLETLVAEQIVSDQPYFFDEAVPIATMSFVVRSYNNGQKSYELAKRTIDSPYFRFENSLLRKQIDGIFCLDGQLQYSKDLKRVVYHHFYRNEIVIADSNLNLVERGHTIDSFSHANIKVATLGSENRTMLTGTPIQINRKACVFGRFLLVNSNLLARNEDRNMFFRNSVIDVYDLMNLEYRSSFYLPHYRDKPAKEFLLFKGMIVALYGRTLVTYELQSDLFFN